MKDFLSKKNIINLLLLGIMVLAIPLTVKLARQQQITYFSRAAAAQIEFLTKEKGGNDCVVNRGGKQVAVCKDVKVRLVAPTGSDIRFQGRTSLFPQGGFVSTVYAGHTCPEVTTYCSDGDVWQDLCDPDYGHSLHTDCGAIGQICEDGACADPPAPCLPDGSCSADTPACGETTTGVDSCDDPCTKTGDACSTTGSSACTYKEEIPECPGNYRECNGTDEGSGCHFNSDVNPACDGSCPSSGGNGGSCSHPDAPVSSDSRAVQCNGNAIGHFTCTGNTASDSNGWSLDENGNDDCPTGTHCVEASGTASCESITGGTTACYLGGGNVDPASANAACAVNHPGSAGRCDPNEAGPYEDGCVGPAGGPPGGGRSCYQCVNGTYVSRNNCTESSPNCSSGDDRNQSCWANTIPQGSTAYCPAAGPGQAECTTGSAESVTQTQAECVIGKRSDILPFYKNNGWCTDKKTYYPGIVNNWKNINGPNEDQILTSCGVDKSVKCTTGSAGSITTTQASCVIGKRADILPFYKNNGWCTDKADYYPGIVNNWMGINSQTDKDQVQSCFGAVEKCFACDVAADGKSKYRYAGSPTGDVSKCPASAIVCNPSNSNTCKGNDSLKDSSCNTGATPTPTPRSTPTPTPPPVTITKFRYAESRADVENAQERVYSEGGVTIDYSFADTTPGQKFIWYQFGDGTRWTEPRNEDILFVGPDPVITGSACNIKQELKENLEVAPLLFEVNGSNFGSRQQSSQLAADNANLEIREWTNQKVVARMTSPPDTTDGKTYTVTLTRADGVRAAATCSVNTTQISFGARLFCRIPNTFDQENVTLTLVQNALGVGVTAQSGSFRAGGKSTGTVTINKDGIISNLRTKLQEGLEYIACLKFQRSLKVCTNKFTASSGNSIIQDFKGIPVCDMNEDGTINSVDTSQCKVQWGRGRNKTCDFNRDNVTNSFEWACCIHPDSFNKSSSQEPQ